MFLRRSALVIWLLVFSTPFFGQESSSPCYEQVEDKTIYPLLNPTFKNRKTAKIQLKNGVRVYLLSDPTLEQSAGAMCVQAGSWQDPDTYPGMAHFLEHMLFMGNAAYPEEFSYTQYIQDNAGNVNAFTAQDHTVYMFTISHEAFSGAVDRFSHFFIDPLFNPSCINRELRAVDQEHAKNVENDFWREYMVLKETGTKGHPHTKFSTGNASTLSGIPQEALKAWYQEHYTAEKMYLVLLSNLPLEEMVSLANEKFSPIVPSSSLIEALPLSPLLSEQQKGHILYIRPIKDLKLLSILFELPSSQTPLEYHWETELLSYVLSERSTEGLFNELKKESLIESIDAGTERYDARQGLFRIDVRLTEQGLLQRDRIIEKVFETLARIKQSGLPLSLFEEMQTLCRIQYQYQSQQDPFSWVTRLASTIADEDLSTFPERSNIPFSFHPENLSQLVTSFTPQSACYVLLGDPDKLGVDTPYKEKWMDVSYGIEAIPTAKLALWQHVSPRAKPSLVPNNPFLPTHLELENPPADDLGPQLLFDETTLKLYFASDNYYRVPEAALLFSLHSPQFDGSARASVFGDLLAKTLNDSLSPTFFFADRAGLSSSFHLDGLEFSLSLSGYSDKAPELAESLFDALLHLNLQEKDFALYKDSLLSAYANGSCNLPVKQAMTLLHRVLLNDAPTPEEKYQSLLSLSYQEASAFFNEWSSQIYVEALLYGNLSKDRVQKLGKTLLDKLASCKPYTERKQEEILSLSSHAGPFKIVETTERQGYGTVLFLEEGPHTFEKGASQKILSVALREAFFDALRTKQQTGYIAQSFDAEIAGQMMQTFAVQSSTHSPENLLIRFDLFLEDFARRLGEIIPPERFSHLKEALVTLLETPPDTLYDNAVTLHSEAFLRKGDFAWIEKRRDAMKDLSYKTFLLDAQDFLSNQKNRIAVLVRGEGQNSSFEYKPLAKEEIVKIKGGS